MANGQTVKSFQDLKNLKGVEKVVDASVGKPVDVERAAEAVTAVLEVALGDAETEDGDLKDLRSFSARDFLRGHKQDTEAFLRDVAKVEEIFEGLSEMNAALGKLEDLNERKKLRVDTPHMRELRARIEAAKGLLEKINPEAVELVRFRRDHGVLRELIQKAYDIDGALKRRERVDEAALKELSSGYADLLHSLIREERIVEVSSEQLQKWANQKPKGESFSDHACSWFYRDCKVCERGRCRTHWFWGVSGDDQSIQLARDLRALNNINSRIRNHLNPKPRRDAMSASNVVATTPTVSETPTEPVEGPTPVEPENGSTES